MEQAINLYITGTYYQLITAVSLALEISEKGQIFHEIYFIERKYKSDLKNITLDGLSINIVPSCEKIPLYKQLKNRLYYKFFFFQEGDILNKYLSFWLQNNGTKIALGPDGAKPYGLFNKKHELLSLCIDTFKDYLSLGKSGLRLPCLIPSRYYCYGATSLIDEVWLQYPSMFDVEKNRTKAIIRQLPELDYSRLNSIEKILQLPDLSVDLGPSPVVYFNQPLWSVELMNVEAQVLKKIISISVKPVYVKFHPKTEEKRKQQLLTINGVKELSYNGPAEFLLAKIKRGCLLTGWSAALMHKVDSNHKFAYLFPFFKQTEDKILNQIKLVPFEHIQVIDSWPTLKRFILS